MVKFMTGQPSRSFCAWLVLLIAASLPSAAIGQTAAERMRTLESRLALVKPDGAGPFPAVILVPGCGGFDDRLLRGRYERAMKALGSQGFVVARADYLAAIGTTTCDLVMDPPAAARDVIAVARHVQAQPFVKRESVNVIGWSFGGGLALGLLSELPPGEASPVAAVVAYSPYLAMSRPWARDVPVLILCTLQDTVAPCERVDALVELLGSRQGLKYMKYPEGFHAFDAAELPAEMLSPAGNRLGHNAATAAAAWGEVTAFLRR